MTTKVTIVCQADSHWPIKVVTQDLAYDPEAKKLTDEWKDSGEITLQRGGSHEAYVYDSRRIVIEEAPM